MTRRPGRLAALAAVIGMFSASFVFGPTGVVHAVPAPVGQGFTITPADLAFILKQIKIAERHSASFAQEVGKVAPPLPPNPDPIHDPEYCSALTTPSIGPNADPSLVVPDFLSPYGLRTVDGSCNNLVPGRQKFAEADIPFPRLTTPQFRPAEAEPTDFFGPGGPAQSSSSYAQKSGFVFDSQPRTISNLIVDQTSSNPAAVAAAEFPVRTQSAKAHGVVPCATVANTNPPVDVDPPTPPGCTPGHHTLFIPNVTTNVGLSPPYNSLFTFFGQFFDHGLDQTLKSGGNVFVPLKDDDPLIAGPDHDFGSDCGTPAATSGCADNLPAGKRFMVLTRAQNQPGPDQRMGTADDVQDTSNSDTPWIDQSQTYTSHGAHQVFLREYGINKKGKTVSTGKLLGGLPGPEASGLSTWAAVKQQAADLLGLKLEDKDVSNIPMIATDPYGAFLPGPDRGLPQYVTTTGLIEGCRATDTVANPNVKVPCDGNPVPVPSNVLHFDTPFLTDIAHNADPGTVGPCTIPASGNTPAQPLGCVDPDPDNVASADFANQPPGTYDDEMLNAHFACGDGRCNENIALSAIHQVFHSEHDRLVEQIKNVLLTQVDPATVSVEWLSGSGAVPVNDPLTGTQTWWNGERLFQAARFINEMEYQHLVFEEFVRKVQPATRVFEGYSNDINPAIPAEFASAVYRFGHSMLDDDVARTNPDGTDNSLPLLTAFLNPPEYFNGHGFGQLTPEQAAGSIVMGSSDQVGNEIDEFVTETLRNNLLGLPLDLPTLNLTRARDVGIPPLNNFRRQLFAKTNDGQLAPYTSWSDFGQHLKHPESLINFVAAYGTHPTILAAITLTAKRDAARAIVNPQQGDTPPADAANFMFSTGPWASGADGTTTTGLDSVDLWVGGLAEATNLNGGLLGSSFNYVFQTSMENLQDGDRFYYLSRTAGLNLLGQLEGNSFSELIQRNTDGTNSLKADAFATADCKFQLANLHSPANSADPNNVLLGAGTVSDDPTTTDCNENSLLQSEPDGTIEYRAINSVDPPGINGQSVYNGTAGIDRIVGGNDNDTFWGNDGNDIIDGSGGDDTVLGGNGNDIITDSSGFDTLKGGPGNDAIDGGPDADLLLGGDGQDFQNGGPGANTVFGGPGNDFTIGGTGADIMFGDGGDDWMEGSSGVDLFHGDHGAPFFDDPGQVAPGNDVFIGQVGDNTYDAEGGDDVMSQNPSVDKNLGLAGFDWAFHQYDTVAADDDMNINNNLNGAAQPIIVNRDTWQETEADSGYNGNDVIRGTNVIPSQVGGAGFGGCDVIDQRGIDRIAGLAAIMPTLTGDPRAVQQRSATGFCPISGFVWGDGDILIGGKGSDTLEGRGGNDILDGDRYLQTRISVRTNPVDPTTEIGSTDLMENTVFPGGTFGLGTAGMTLQQAVFDGLVDPGNLVTVREIITPNVPADCTSPLPGNCDTAVFSGPQGNYVVTVDPDGTAHVRATGASASDGTDTLRNIERLSFCNGQIVGGNCSVARTVVPLAATPAPVLTGFTPSSALRGAVVTLNGTNFAAMTSVTVTFSTATGSVVVANPQVTPTAITVVVPQTAVSGPVQVTNEAGSSSQIFLVQPKPADPPPPPPPPAPLFTAIQPVRAFDTRPGQPGLLRVEKAKVVGVHELDMHLIGSGGVPSSGVTAVSLNVTADGATGPGFVTVYPCGERPNASSVNFVAGQTVANAVIAPVAADGNVCFYSNAPVDLIVDVNGWFASGSGFSSVTPTRLFDTRPAEAGAVSVPSAKVGGGEVLDVKLVDVAGVVPAVGVGALSLNVTVDGAQAAGYVTVYPCGTQPLASNVNFVAGQTVANAVIAPVSADGHVCFFASTPVDLIVDVNGWFASGSGFTSVAPARAFDTRRGQAGVVPVDSAQVGGSSMLDVQLTGMAGLVPASGVGAVSLNVTADGALGAGFVTVYPCGTRPLVSSVNFVAGQTVANAVIAPLSADGHVCFFANTPVDLIVDVNGWFATN